MAERSLSCNTFPFLNNEHPCRCPVEISVETSLDLLALVVVEGFFEGFDDRG